MSKITVVLLTIFGLCYGTPRGDIIESRVSRVPPATPEAAPYQIYLWYPDMSAYLFAGGTIISSRTILTSAIVFLLYSDKQINEFVVIAGANIRDSVGYPYIISDTLIHPNFDNKTEENAKALLYVDRDIYFNDQIQPIELGFFDVAPGTIVTLNGWIYMEWTLEWHDKELRVINLPTISMEECKDMIMGTTENYMCTYMYRSEGACLGHFGGSLVYGNYIVGIQLSGFYTCLEEDPDVYTQVSPYRDWIIQNLK